MTTEPGSTRRAYVTFKHGYIMMGDPGGDDCTTGALTGGADYGPQDHVVFEDSYGEGADGEDTHAGCGSTNSAYIDNALSNTTRTTAQDSSRATRVTPGRATTSPRQERASGPHLVAVE